MTILSCFLSKLRCPQTRGWTLDHCVKTRNLNLLWVLSTRVIKVHSKYPLEGQIIQSQELKYKIHVFKRNLLWKNMRWLLMSLIKKSVIIPFKNRQHRSGNKALGDRQFVPNGQLLIQYSAMSGTMILKRHQLGSCTQQPHKQQPVRTQCQP